MIIAHCADIHLGRRPAGTAGEYSRKRYSDYFEGFRQIARIAIDNKAKVLCIAGDMFDRRELMPEVLELTEEILKEIIDAGIKIIYTEGNHDNITQGRESEAWPVYLDRKGLLKRLGYRVTESGYEFDSITVNDIRFYGLGYPGSMAGETFAELAAHLDRKPDDKPIVLVHTAVCNDDFVQGTVKSEVMKLLQGKAMYVLGGHMHHPLRYPAAQPFFFVPGSSEYWDLKEKPADKGIMIYDTETGRAEHINVIPRRKLMIDYDIQSDNAEDFIIEFNMLCNSLDITQSEDIVLINLKQKSHFYLDIARCEQILYSCGALKAQVSIASAASGPQGEYTMSTPVSQIEEDIISGWEQINIKPAQMVSELDKLKQYQDSGDETDFIECFESVIEMNISGGKE